jgi:hypothetical protein
MTNGHKRTQRNTKGLKLFPWIEAKHDITSHQANEENEEKTGNTVPTSFPLLPSVHISSSGY